jgi:hypothetical protein
MDPKLAEKLRSEFPKGEALGWERLMAEHAMFWDREHRRMTAFSDRQILIVLIWANFYAAQWGTTLHLHFDEKKLWKRHFMVPSNPATALI